MNELTGDILRCLFDKRYMDFKTCSSLRSVFALFNVHATKYFRSINKFDLLVLKKNFGWGSNSIGTTSYTCLLETVTKHCVNLEKITGIMVGSDKLNLVSQVCLQKLHKLTRIVISDETLKSAVLFNFLKQFPNLWSVKAEDVDDDRDEDDVEDENVPEEEKLVVSELNLYCGDFWRIFCVDHLSKLEYSTSMFVSEEDVNTFCGVVERCQRLEQLEVEVFGPEGSKYLPPLLRLAEVMPHPKQSSLNMEYFSVENWALIARQYPSVGKYTRKLHVTGADPAGNRELICFV